MPKTEEKPGLRLRKNLRRGKVIIQLFLLLQETKVELEACIGEASSGPQYGKVSLSVSLSVSLRV